MFNLIPTESLEYRVYADWLEDQGVVLTAAVRKGILSFSCLSAYGDAYYTQGNASSFLNSFDPVFVNHGFGLCSREQSGMGQGSWNDEFYYDLIIDNV